MEEVEVVPKFGVYGNGVIITIASLIIALLTWWLFADPEWAIVSSYPFPFLFVVVWMILAVVWFAFNWELSIFNWLPEKQPARGVGLVISALVLTFVAYLILNVGWGAINPNFAVDSATGWALSAFIVLIGFLTWTMLNVTFLHWPFADAGVKQPLLGTCEWILGAVLTLAFYFALVYPSLVHPDHALLDFFTMTGWWYSCIVGVFVVSILWGNWPFNKIEDKGKAAIGSLLFGFVVGTVWYFISTALLKGVLISQDVQTALASVAPTNINYFAAEYGVCTLCVLLLLFLLFGNWPTKFSEIQNILVRTSIWFVGGTILFLVFMNGFATGILHEPSVLGSWGGDPLNFIDWWICIFLMIAVYFGCWPLMKEVEIRKEEKEEVVEEN